MAQAFPSTISQLAPSRRQLGFASLAGLGTLSVGAAAHASASNIRTVSAEYRAADQQRLLDLVNAFRAQNGLGALRHSATVATVMEGEARRQFNENAFSHSSQFLNDSRVQGYTFAREVIALTYNDDINELLSFWKSSPAHRAAVLAPEADTCGIGLCYGNGVGLPWRILGNMAIYRYGNGGPSDIRSSVSEATASTASFSVKGGIGARYYADGGADRYGEPVMNEKGGLIYGGYYQIFERSDASFKMMWVSDFGAQPVYQEGAIGRFWMSQGHENGLGYPVCAEQGGLVNGGAYQIFQKGSARYSVLWSPTTGVNAVKDRGAIGAMWHANGAENTYGYPTTGEYKDGIYVRQNFSNNTVISWNSLTGRVSVR